MACPPTSPHTCAALPGQAAMGVSGGEKALVGKTHEMAY